MAWVKPKLTFWEVVEKYGWPVVSKKQARYINDLQRPTANNERTRNLRLTGLNSKGELCPSMKLAKKWLPLIDSGFKVSEKCCDVLKKNPMEKYAKKTGRRPITGVMAGESNNRLRGYQREGCNLYDAKKPISNPMQFWLEKDIWAYIKKYDLPYSGIYDQGEPRTGCKYCLFGCHLEKGENRFQRMRRNFPGQFKNFKRHGGCEVLDFINVEY